MRGVTPKQPGVTPRIAGVSRLPDPGIIIVSLARNLTAEVVGLSSVVPDQLDSEHVLVPKVPGQGVRVANIEARPVVQLTASAGAVVVAEAETHSDFHVDDGVARGRLDAFCRGLVPAQRGPAHELRDRCHAEVI